MDEPTVDQMGLGDTGPEPVEGATPPAEAAAQTSSLFADPVTPPPVTQEPQAAPVTAPVEPAPAPASFVDAPPAPQVTPIAPAPASVPPATEAQPSLLDAADVGVVVAAVPPAAAAKAADLTGATNVATYGDRDLDEMVAELAKSAPAPAAATGAAAAAQAAPAAEGDAATTTEGAEGDAATEGGTPAGDADAADAAETATPAQAEAVPAPNWPFLAYAGVWAAFAIGLAFVMKPAAVGGSVFASPYYQLFLGGGLALAVAGPVLVLVVWLFARRGYEKGHRGGLFSSALIKGALALFVGVLLWWAAYYAAVWLAASGR